MISKTSGIYKITCTLSGKIYIGQSKNMSYRVSSHKRDLRKNIHRNTYLQNSYNKYGLDNFKFEELEQCDVNLLNEREAFWAESIDKNKLMNIGAMGNGFRILTEISSQISARQKRKWKDPDYRETMIASAKKRILPEELIKNHTKGKKHTEKSRKNMSESKKGRPLSFENKIGLARSKRSLKEGVADFIRKDYISGLSTKQLCEKWDTSKFVIHDIVRGRSYKLGCDEELLRACSAIKKRTRK